MLELLPLQITLHSLKQQLKPSKITHDAIVLKQGRVKNFKNSTSEPDFPSWIGPQNKCAVRKLILKIWVGLEQFYDGSRFVDRFHGRTLDRRISFQNFSSWLFNRCVTRKIGSLCGGSAVRRSVLRSYNAPCSAIIFLQVPNALFNSKGSYHSETPGFR